ncbi:Rho-binding antiterminator [Porticoccus sp. W117]|uniref:Rho-binding antiterminator n=1 Tax=Porticoccus sp. W117 TaxID=3054777 RepID=UPI002591559A|nr:Rho-binding antiterminator [Porticoccus sp. W117]MDM3870882.1 Rho-binding antiterminator [Porticoccus sp. W117]
MPPLPCSIHDHLELACIAAAELRIELRDGSAITATPITTETRSNKTEWLKCKNGEEVPLDQIKAFEPTAQTSLFARVEAP